MLIRPHVAFSKTWQHILEMLIQNLICGYLHGIKSWIWHNLINISQKDITYGIRFWKFIHITEVITWMIGSFLAIWKFWMIFLQLLDMPSLWKMQKMQVSVFRDSLLFLLQMTLKPSWALLPLEGASCWWCNSTKGWNSVFLDNFKLNKVSKWLPEYQNIEIWSLISCRVIKQ